MALDTGAIISSVALATFWTGFGLGHYHGGREEARQQLVKLEKRRELEQLWHKEDQANTKTRNEFWEWYTKRQEPRHVRIQAPSKKTPSEIETQFAES